MDICSNDLYSDDLYYLPVFPSSIMPTTIPTNKKNKEQEENVKAIIQKNRLDQIE